MRGRRIAEHVGWRLGLACAGLVCAPPLAAQTTAGASVSATAFVLTLAPLTASPVNDLNFGNVLAGTSASPVSLASDAGRFDLTGEPNGAITLTFTLPTDLTGPGGTIPLTFGASDGLWWGPFPASFTTFDPTAPFAVLLDGAGALTIGITGTVSPPGGTLPGLYTATITLTVGYL